jgi:hypothetical protein
MDNVNLPTATFTPSANLPAESSTRYPINVSPETLSYSQKLSDQDLFFLCKKWGKLAILARRKFIGLIPEVNRRKLYEKKGFSSIYHFAAVLAGVSHDQVDIAIRLYRQLEGMEVLQSAMAKGEIGINKLARIASIATPKNQAELLEKAKILSKAALDVFVKDLKNENLAIQEIKNNEIFEGLFGEKIEENIRNRNTLFGENLSGKNLLLNEKSEGQNGLLEAKITPKSLYVQTANSSSNSITKSNANYSINLNSDLKLLQSFSPELKQKLFELKEKGFNLSELLLGLLKNREKEIEQKKAEIAGKIEEKRKGKINETKKSKEKKNKNEIKNGISTKPKNAQKEAGIRANAGKFSRDEYSHDKNQS